MAVAMKTRVTNLGGQIVAAEYGETRYLIEPDALGNTRSLIDETGAEADSYTYWPYGEQRTATVGLEFPFKFCGTWGYYTEPLGGYPLYVRARYYKPPMGRWMTVDPLWPWQLQYEYVQDRPTCYIDPLGLLLVNAIPYPRRVYPFSFDLVPPQLPPLPPFGDMPGRPVPPLPTAPKCQIRICRQYGLDIPVPSHMRICVLGDTGDLRCGGGLYPTWPAVPDGQVGDNTTECKSDPATQTVCEDIASDCTLAQAVCNCIDRWRHDPPPYVPPFNTCYDFPRAVMDCACGLYFDVFQRDHPTQVRPGSAQEACQRYEML